MICLFIGADEIQLSSPISRTEEKFYEEDIEKDAIKPSAGLDRLKALASTRNQWEDEVSSSTNKVCSCFTTFKDCSYFLSDNLACHNERDAKKELETSCSQTSSASECFHS